MEGKIKTRGRRLLVLFAVLLAATALMCVSAFAADVASITKDEVTTPYSTFADALTAAQNGDTIKLLDNVSIGDMVAIGKSITVDGTNGDGKFTVTLTRSAKDTTGIFVGADVTFKNVIVTSNDKLDYGAFEIGENNSLILENSDIQNAPGAIWGAVGSRKSGATFKMINSTITGASASWPAFKGVAVAFPNGGTFEMDADSSISSCSGSAIGDVPNPYVVAVYGGTGSVNIAGSVTGGTNAGGVYFDSTKVTGNVTSAVSRIADSDVYFWTLDEAVSSAPTGSTIKVLTNTTLNGVWIGKTLTIDGMGNTVRVKNADDTDKEGGENSIALNADGNLTLRDITITRTDKNAYFAVLRVNGGKLTLGSGTTVKNVSGGNASAIYMSADASGVVNMEEGSLIDSCYTGVLGDGCLDWGWSSIGLEGGTFNMNGGKITGCVAPHAGVPSAIWLKGDKVTVNLNGGEITGNTGGCGAVGASVGTVNVKAAAKVTNNNNGGINIKKMADVATVNALDGTVTGNREYNESYYDLSNVALYNGTLYTVADAINACSASGGTITLVDNATLAGMAKGGEKYTLDGQGYTLTLTRSYTIAGLATIILKNVTVDLSQYEELTPAGDDALAVFIFWNDASLTLDEGAVITNYAPTKDRPVMLLQNNTTATLKTGSKLTNLDSSNVNYVTVNDKGENVKIDYINGLGIKSNSATATLNINGGEISNVKTADTEKNRGAAIYLGNGTINMTEGVITNCKTAGGKVSNNGGAVFVAVGTMNMSGGTITGCDSLEGGAIYVCQGAIFNMTGGEISGNTSWSGSGIRAASGAVLHISGDAVIYNNLRKDNAPDNIRANEVNALNINAEFTGKLGFMFNISDDKPDDKNVLNAKIGTIADGLTLASVDSVVCDTDPTLFAYVSGTDLILTKKLALSAATDNGKYTKKATGETVYGVVRVNTTVTEVPDASPVTEIGTYFYVGASDPGVVVEETKTNCYKPNVAMLAAGMGYTADVVDITDPTATVYAVNFYKLNGINGYVFEAPVAVAYAQAEAKDLGADPEQLIYE